ncbi:MAG: bifunctional oligoribonuclease/PAP phosphatase NrnA [Gemmatimonadota bacterium]
MSYRTPQSRRGPVTEVLKTLNGAQCILLTTHINADGDGAGSEVALAAWLRSQGKEVWIINPTPYPDSLGFLLPEKGWTLDPGSSDARNIADRADLAVILDTGEWPRIGSVMGLVQKLPTVVIDHHPPGPDPIPGVSFRAPEACATGELVFDILMAAEGPWPPEAIQGLYVALLSDTGSFRFSNTSPDTHRIAAFLLDRGADPEELYRLVYGNVSLRRLRLLQAALGELEMDPEGDLAWITVPPESFEELGATADDIEGLVDYPRAIKGVEVGLLFRETARGATKVSFRSNGDTDVNALAREFGGGGHVRASGALVERPLAEVRLEVLEAVRNQIRGRKGDASE